MQEQNDKIYMQYICKNNKCGRIFIAEDIYNRSDPEIWRYCPICESKGKQIIREDPYIGTDHYNEIHAKRVEIMKKARESRNKNKEQSN